MKRSVLLLCGILFCHCNLSRTTKGQDPSSFAAVSSVMDIANWIQTGSNNSLQPLPSTQPLFRSEIINGLTTITTQSTLTNIHAHLINPTFQSATNFQYLGQLFFDHANAGLGVTFSSGYPDSDRYYRLRRGPFTGGDRWHIDSHGDSAFRGCTSDILSQRNVWTSFKVKLTSTSTGVRIQARLWQSGSTEPSNWQLDCMDEGSTVYPNGAIGVWSMGSGIKRWARLSFEPLQISPPPPPPSMCPTSSPTWQNTAFTAQSGQFEVKFDATPSASAVDALTALSLGQGQTYDDFAVLLRFNPNGFIDAINDGRNYSAVNPIPYLAGKKYSFRAVVSVPSRTYSAFVKPEGMSQEITLANHFKFRGTQNAVASLSNWGRQASTGSHQVCFFSIAPVQNPLSPPTILTHPQNLNIVVGSQATFSVIASGNPAPSYQWRKNGINIVGANSSSYTTSPTILADAGTLYSVVVTNSVGSALSQSALLSVTETTPPPIGGALQLPQIRLVSWSPGVEGGVPNTSNWRVVSIPFPTQSAINQALPNTILQLPAGTWSLEKLEMRSNVVLRGMGPTQTRIRIVNGGASAGQYTTPSFCDKAGIHFCGIGRASSVAVTGGLGEGSFQLTLASTSGINVGDFIFLDQAHDPILFDAPQRDGSGNLRRPRPLGFIARVLAKTGLSIRMDRPLIYGFSTAFNPQVGTFTPVQYAGLENLKVEVDIPSMPIGSDGKKRGPSAVRVSKSVNVWIRNVTVQRGFLANVQFEQSARSTLEGSHLYTLSFNELNPSTYTNAYSVTIAESSTDLLVTNNILTDSFIPVILQIGAARNVVSYNYIYTQRCSHGIFLHGEYPQQNLIEGNDSNCNITIDNYWGKQGPKNMVFRNRIGNFGQPVEEATGIRLHHDDFYRFIADQLAFIGNVTRGFFKVKGCSMPQCLFHTNPSFDFDRLTTNLWGEKNLFTENLVRISDEPTTTYLDMLKGNSAPTSWRGEIPASFYLHQRPHFWPTSKPWPGIGADVDQIPGSLSKLPAQERWIHAGQPNP